MRFFSHISNLLIVISLTACGGGGGSAGVTSGTPATLTTTAPSTLTLGVGASQTYTIGGGRSPYTTSSSDSRVSTSSTRDNALTINGVATGAVKITVTDADAKTVSIDVAVGSLLPLNTTAPASLTVAVGASQTYSISGGRPPYKVSSSNVLVSSAGTNNSELTIGGVKPGTATITVIDADAKTVDIKVTVPDFPAFTTTAPAALTLAQGTRRSFQLSGGLANYSVQSTDNRFVAASVFGTTLNIDAIALTSTAVPVQVSDQTGKVLTIAVTVSSSSTVDVFTNAPAALSVGQKSTTTFLIGGGTPPYSVVTNNSSAAVASVNGTILTITSFAPSTTGAGNVAIVTVRDANGKTATPIAVSVTTLPFVLSSTDITAFVGMDIDINISGGTPPYRVSSSISAAVTATLLPSQTDFRLTLNLPSDVEVSVLDANNQQQKVKVKVQAGLPSLSLSPSAITVSEKDDKSILLTITGAAPGVVNVFSSDTKRLVATPPASGGNVVIVNTGTSRCVAADTNVNITVIDSKGASGTAVITIKDNGNIAPVVGPPAVPGSDCPP